MKKASSTIVLWFVLLTPSLAPVARAGDVEVTGESASSGWHTVFSPDSDLYPRYVADPRRPRFRVVRMSFQDSEIADAGDTRFGLMVGGRYGFLRFHPDAAPDRGIQIDLEGAISGQFDLDSSQDNIGWDGLYGLQVAWAPRRGPVLRFAIFHQSAHLGDEFIEETGRERINYTRQEHAAGASWGFRSHWRVYGEAARGFDLRNEQPQDRWRGQYGLEYESDTVIGNHWGWYAAVDSNHYQEDHWNATATFQGGLRRHVERLARTYRFGIEYGNGRSQMGEFSREDERYIALGVWFDL